MVHWKVGHFAALLDPKGGLYPIGDDTAGFGREEIQIDEISLEEEASGYFLVPAGPLPKGWRAVSLDEAKSVWGRGYLGKLANALATAISDLMAFLSRKAGDDSDCGMTDWDAHSMLVSLALSDTPVGLSPAAFAVPFRVTYAHREVGQPAVFDYSNLGPKWTSNWTSFVTDDRASALKARHYKPGGGGDEYSFTSGANDPISEQNSHTHAIMHFTVGSGFSLEWPDGSRDEFFHQVGSRYHLTSRITPQGNTTTVEYDALDRISGIRDAAGRLMTLSYDLPTDPLKITQVTDPFGRSASFTYTPDGHLESVTDVLGLVSSYQYGVNDFITSLTTPYGTTNFTYGDISTVPGSGTLRFLEIVDPMGRTYRVENAEGSSTGIPQFDPQPPVGMPVWNSTLEGRNTFIWEPHQLTSPPDYSKATIHHFLHLQGGPVSVRSRVPESIKRPLETRVWFAYPGPIAAGFFFPNLSRNTPTHVGRVLDDGSTQLTQYQYNSRGFATQMTDPTGRVFDYTYAPNEIDLTTVSTGGQTLFSATYDANHNITSVTDASGGVSNFTYNARGQVLTATNPLGETTTNTYTPTGNLASIQAPLQALTTFSYDSAERVSSATDTEGYTVQATYDVFDRPVSVTYPDGTSDTLTYQNLDLVGTTDRIGRQTQRTFDPLRRLTSVIDGNGGTTGLGYGPEDSPTSLTDPNGNTTSFQYDLQERLITKTYPGGATQTMTYESCMSRVKSVTDALGQSKTYEYFVDNMLKSVQYSGNTPTVTFTQDTFLPRPLTMTDGQGTTTMTYGSVGSPGGNLLASISGPYGDQASFTYDIAGRPVNRTVNGSVESMVYDQLWRTTSTTNLLDTFQMSYLGKTGQVTQVSSSQGPTTQFAYTPNSTDRRLAQIKNLRNGGVTAISQFDYTYDAIGQITQLVKTHGEGGGGTTGGTTGTTGGTTGTGGDTGTTGTTTGGGTGTTGTTGGGNGNGGGTGNNTGTGTGGGTGNNTGTGTGGGTGNNTGTGTGGGTGNNTGTGTGGGTGNNTGTGTGGGTGNSNNGNGTGNGNGNGGGNGNGNNGNGNGNGGPIAQMLEVLESVWGIDTSEWDEGTESALAAAAITNSTETLDFRYDNLSQLIGVDINQTPHASYQFDPAGNMTSITLNGVTTNLTYNSRNQIETPGTNVFDAKGQTTDQDGRTFEWDEQGRVTAIVQGTHRSEFEYDGLSRRTAIVEIENGVVESRKLYWWLGGAIVCERDGLQAGFPINKRYFGQGVMDGTTKLYYTLDHLGSVQELTDETGEVVADYRYSIYGERTKDSGTADSDFGFAGLFHHAPSGLDLATYRLYDSRQRRFISRDPLGEAVDYNLYRYANNNPVMFTDPSGLLTNDQILTKVTGSYDEKVLIYMGLLRLRETARGREILDSLTDDNFKGLTASRKRGAGNFGEYSTGLVGIDFDLAATRTEALYLTECGDEVVMNLLESTNGNVIDAIAVALGHEFGHLLGTGDDDDYSKGKLIMRRMRHVMEVEDPIRVQMGLGNIRIAYGNEFKSVVPTDWTHNDAITEVRRVLGF